MKPRRDPLAKPYFGESVRQKWAAILILCAGGVLYANIIEPQIQPEPYLTFLTMVGCVFLAGMSVDSYAKIRKAEHNDSQTTNEDR
jgi:hypothetical protein